MKSVRHAFATAASLLALASVPSAQTPFGATDITAKAQEFSTKYAGKSDAEACKVVDELIASIKG